jgi:hypothetical protein
MNKNRHWKETFMIQIGKPVARFNFSLVEWFDRFYKIVVFQALQQPKDGLGTLPVSSKAPVYSSIIKPDSILDLDQPKVEEGKPTSSSRDGIFAAISREREYQQCKWGDKPHTVGEWLLIAQGELDEAISAWTKDISDEQALSELLQVTAVGVAALEQHGVVERPFNKHMATE